MVFVIFVKKMRKNIKKVLLCYHLGCIKLARTLIRHFFKPEVSLFKQ